MSVSSTREPVQAFWASHDGQYLAEDAVLTDMGSGQEVRGRQAISQMLHYLYHIAFEARAEQTHALIADGSAVVEGFFVGKHQSEFAGIPATQQEVRVPMCVAYQVENDHITRARVYLQSNVLMQQLGA